jgi:hypothetical protein
MMKAPLVGAFIFMVSVLPWTVGKMPFHHSLAVTWQWPHFIFPLELTPAQHQNTKTEHEIC